jgi:hypothetical protein
MSNTVFFVQNNLVEHLTAPVAKFAHINGYEIIDRSSTSSMIVDDCGVDWNAYSSVFIYGSVQFLRKAKQSSLSKYVQYDEKAFSNELWEFVFQNELLNCGGSVCKASEITLSSPIHIRPLNEDKAFTAKVFDSESWQAVQCALSPDLLCWVSPVKGIDAEWRCWFIGGELVGASQYREDNAMKVVRGAPEHVLAYTQDIASHWLPAECVVMDVALTLEGLKIVEFNPIHCSGWYAADVENVLQRWVEFVGK